ncbi:hypothetical protein [Caballeronia calidae]|uniref:hypothetical protein n=1 Tax=Caballeronia calidae TaxID=1777139 RepID=UPI0012FE07D5|nr:hypothetical protein [Caballeronia calidae]
MTEIENRDSEPSASSPWRERMVRRGLVYFQGMRYSSIELQALWRGQTGGELIVLVKPVAEGTSYLTWKPDEGAEGLLSLVEQDARRFGDLSWNEVDGVLKRESELLTQPRSKPQRVREPTRK